MRDDETERPAERLPDTPLLLALFVAPALHPLLLPLVGVASHLLWFLHVLPVALLIWIHGRRWTAPVLVGSAAVVLGGERLLGAGYWVPAPWQTAISLAVAVTFANGLVAGFAVYARAARDRYRLLFHRVTMGVLRVDPDGRVLEVNPEAAEILDAEPTAVTGRRIHEIVGSPAFDSMETLVRAGAWTDRIEVLAGDEPRPLHAFVATVAHPDSGEYQVLLADRTLEVLQAREIERQSKLAALGEALAGVAHELKNPLTAILGHAELGLDDDGLDPETREIFAVVKGQAERMRDLVRELLGFSRSDPGGECTDLAALLRRVARVQRISLPRDVELELEVAWEGEVSANPTKVEQIVLNLLSNAAYALDRHADGGTVRVTCRAEGGTALVEVADDGPGIDPEVMDTVFEPFTTTKPPGEGTGLGLAISRRLARGWGGDLEARNSPEGGARFLLRLPVSAAVAGSDGADEGSGSARDAREPAA